MRDIKRIDRILELLGDYWKEHPDYRFGQMLINIGVCDDAKGLWQNKDEEFEEYLIGLNKKEDKQWN